MTEHLPKSISVTLATTGGSKYEILVSQGGMALNVLVFWKNLATHTFVGAVVDVGAERSPPPLPATALAMAKLSAVANDRLWVETATDRRLKLYPLVFMLWA